ncbi:hypothetical protein EDB84DRAFT_1435636 [Lactarius hengduanensis]|nr:hypothetical protein EDB84DRAFT_1435636 [Lactarius hengduanensis]
MSTAATALLNCLNKLLLKDSYQARYVVIARPAIIASPPSSVMLSLSSSVVSSSVVSSSVVVVVRAQKRVKADRGRRARLGSRVAATRMTTRKGVKRDNRPRRTDTGSREREETRAIKTQGKKMTLLSARPSPYILRVLWVEKGESKVKESKGKRETTRDERSVEVKRGSKAKKENGDKEEGEWRQGDAGGVDEAH